MSESVQAIPPFVDSPLFRSREELRPTAREWARHSILFLLTVITSTMAGIVAAAPMLNVPEPPLASVLDYLLYVPQYYLLSVGTLVVFALTHPQILTEGLVFSLALLTILTAHEMGHYVACRRYGVSATLPFFIPAPPLFLAGTFGAFIKIKSPIPSRRALFDIGLAGPLAGFVVAVPVAIMGILTMQPAVPARGYGIIFHDPLLLRVLARLLGVPLDPYSPTNSYYLAAWIGLLVTSLNLMPVGQLDGGHGTFAVFGQGAHRLIGRVAFVTMAVLAVLGFFWHGSPSGFLYTVLLAVMLRVRHPQPEKIEPLGVGRILVGIVTLIVFALCFWPFPITISYGP
ncbi:MAG: site-2 protease family protein [Pyrinomonadaceae bacterium]